MFVRLALAADLDADELEHLRDITSQRAGVGKRAIERKLKAARQERDNRRAEELRDQRAAERHDPRPQITAPEDDAPWLPVMEVLNDVLGASADAEPPMRDIDGAYTQVRVRRIPSMHALTAAGANEGEADDRRLPAPEQPLLTRLNEAQLGEAIERHIDYTDPSGRSVHLALPFVRHYLNRTDDALPLVAAIATLPMVLQDGTLLHGRGLVHERGILFRIPPELMTHIPTADACHDYAAVDALTFLTDTWLLDVATDHAGKCCLIAAALTLIERSLLPDRPAFFVTAGRRGGGKTTTLIMLLMAITGMRPAAAAWSPNEEERRKAILAYLMEALPAIIWDNIARGAQISCTHVERACTTAFYSDRRLGVSELVAVAASAIMFFTGNNIAPRGDLASRSLTVRLEIERSDPENRLYTHPDPVAWTEANRGKILNALFTLLLANPNLGPAAQQRTRFKAWYQLVGSAVEHAVTLAGGSLDFQALFLAQEADEEESSSLADALGALADKWPNTTNFTASDVATMVNDRSEFVPDAEIQRSQILREVLFPNAPPNLVATPRAVGKRLHRHLGEPITRDGKTLILKEWRPQDGGPKGALAYFVQVKG
jgi:hypothetical protein